MTWDTDNSWDTGLPTPPPTYTPPGYVYRAPRVPYFGVTPVELDRLIAEAERKLALMKSVRDQRAEGTVTMYECEECGTRFMTADECIEHLEIVHYYPEEDASLATKMVYVGRNTP